MAKKNEVFEEVDAPETPKEEAVQAAPAPEPMSKNKATPAKKELDDEALRRVCSAMGIDYNDVLAREKAQEAASKAEVEMRMGSNTVRINGQIYGGTFKCSRDVADTINHMIGAKRMRLIDERMGRDFQVLQMIDGRVGSRLIKTTAEGDFE